MSDNIIQDTARNVTGGGTENNGRLFFSFVIEIQQMEDFRCFSIS